MATGPQRDGGAALASGRTTAPPPEFRQHAERSAGCHQRCPPAGGEEPGGPVLGGSVSFIVGDDEPLPAGGQVTHNISSDFEVERMMVLFELSAGRKIPARFAAKLLGACAPVIAATTDAVSIAPIGEDPARVRAHGQDERRLVRTAHRKPCLPNALRILARAALSAQAGQGQPSRASMADNRRSHQSSQTNEARHSYGPR